MVLYRVKEEWHEEEGRAVLVRSDGKKFRQDVCSSCGDPFHYPVQRGRPPKRCPECRKKEGLT